MHHTVWDRQDISRRGGSQLGRRTNRERAPQCRCKELKEREKQHEDGGLDSSLLQPGGEHEEAAGAAAINGLPPDLCAVSVLFSPQEQRRFSSTWPTQSRIPVVPRSPPLVTASHHQAITSHPPSLLFFFSPLLLAREAACPVPHPQPRGAF